MNASLLGWLDAHAGAVTALATVILVVITAAYVVATYQLVREQRFLGQNPKVVFQQANQGSADADLQLHNVGSGAASALRILLGPGDGVEVTMPDLGSRRALLAGSGLTWAIRPAPGSTTFSAGELPLTLRYIDNSRRRIYFHLILIQFMEGADGVKPAEAGSVSSEWNRRELRKLTLRSLRVWQRPGFLLRTRAQTLSVLLLEKDVHDALRARLTKSSENLRIWNERAEEYGEKV